MLTTLLSLFREPLMGTTFVRSFFGFLCLMSPLMSHGQFQKVVQSHRVWRRRHETMGRVTEFAFSQRPWRRTIQSLPLLFHSSEYQMSRVCSIDRLPFERFDGTKQPRFVGPNRWIHLPSPRFLIHGHWGGDTSRRTFLSPLLTHGLGWSYVAEDKRCLFAIGSLVLLVPWLATYKPVARSLELRNFILYVAL